MKNLFNNDDEFEERDEHPLVSSLRAISSWRYGAASMKARLLFVIVAISFLFLSIGYKIVISSISPELNNFYFGKNEKYRREIVDRNNVPLAINLPGASLYANPKKIFDKREAADKISEIFTEISANKLYDDFTSNKSFVWIKRDLTHQQKHLIKNLGLPGIYFEEEERRIYPYGNIFAHLIGYVNRENEGLAGLEKSYNDYLQDREDKTPLKLTLDARLQSIVNEEIDKAIEKFSAEGGSAVIIDPNNGEVLAAVSKPDFNPHFPGNAKSEELFNNFAMGVYELGSIMKIPNLAIGLDSKKVTMYDAYDTSSLRVANFNIRDVHKIKGWNSLPQIFLNSSNIGMAQIIMDIGKDDYVKYIEKFGYTKKLDIEIPEKASPIIQNYNHWSDLTMATLSYGYAMSISPLHFLNSIVPIVNGGTSYQMHFVKKQEAPEGVRILDEETSLNMRKLLRLAVEKGTARNSNVKGYLVSGKTGTAEKVVDGKYAKNKARRTSFLSAFPANKPKYVIFMMLDDPQPTKETFGFATAGWTVAPSVKNIITRIVALYGISPYDEDDVKIKQQLHVDYEIGAEA